MKRVLLVHPDPEARHRLRGALMGDCEVWTAGDERDALALIARSYFDVIVSSVPLQPSDPADAARIVPFGPI